MTTNRKNLPLVCMVVLMGAMLTLVGYVFRPHPAPVFIGISPWPGNEPLALAEELGYYRGGPLRVQRLANNTQILRYYRTGAIRYAVCTLGEAIRLRSDGFRPRIIAIMDVSHGADVVIAAKTAPDLPPSGARIAFEPGELGEYQLARFCEIRHISLGQLVPVHLPVNEQESALVTGRIDYAITYPPFRERLLAKGGRIIFSSKEIPGEIVDVLVAEEEELRNSPADAASLVGAIRRARGWMHGHRPQAAEILACNLGMNSEEIWPMLEELPIPDDYGHRLLSGKPSAIEVTTRRMAEVMVECKLIPSLPDLGGLVYPEASKVQP